MVYVVVMYNKKTEVSNSSVFDTEEEALNFVSDNNEIDKKYNEEKDWIYKIFNVVW